MPSVKLLQEIYETLEQGDEWLKKVPNEVSDAFFDNPYANAYYEAVKILLQEAFKEHFFEAEWLLFEWAKGLDATAPDGTITKINKPEDYYEHLVKHEGWTDE